MKPLTLVAVLIAGAASAQGARLAIHPLELREMTAAQQEIVQAQFDIMLARITDIRLAGSTAVDEALHKPAGKGCETRDECLRFFAESTESLYAVYARVRPDPLGAQLLINARVVRADGAVMRKVTLAAPLDPAVEQTETARLLLARLVDELELNKLSATQTVEPMAMPAPPRLFEQPTIATTSLRRSAGFALVGVGGVTLIAGGVVAGLAVDGRSKLTPDSKGAVPQSQSGRALTVAHEAQAATALIPIGVAIAVVGGVLAWWPTADAPVAVSMIAGAGHAGVQVGGRFP